LHSHLSGKADSYQPPSPSTLTDEMKTTTESVAENDNFQEEILCGDGAYYIGRLLNKIAKNRSCYECIVHTRYTLWPKTVVMLETATRDDEERERRERKRRALNKQQKLLEEMAQAQKAFLENCTGESNFTKTQSSNLTSNMECDEALNNDTSTSMHINGASLSNLIINIDDINSNNSIKESGCQEESTVDCVICNQTVAIKIDQQYRDPIGLVILIQVCFLILQSLKIFKY